VTDDRVESGGVSFGVLPPLAGHGTLRVRLFRGDATVQGEPDPGSTIDVTFALPENVAVVSNAAGIDLKGYSPADETAQAFYAKVPMQLDITGNFHQIAKFAFELGKVDRIINVENIVLQDPAVSGDEIVLRGHCLATAFHALTPKGSPRGEGAQ